jgi:putative transposase
MNKTNEYQFFHRRKLPHIQPEDSIIFVTFRLALSMPKEYFDNMHFKEDELRLSFKNCLQTAENKLMLSKKLFALQDSYLDKLVHKDNYFLNSSCAKIISDELQIQDTKMFDLFAYTIMPNHIHILFKPLQDSNGEYYSIAEIMKFVKGRSSRLINLELRRSGKLWLKEYYDHYIRNDQEFNNCVKYIFMNPVKAGLIDKAQNWQWTWLKPELEYMLYGDITR